jgi:hypothetical protein
MMLDFMYTGHAYNIEPELLVWDLSLDVINGVRRLDLSNYGLASQGRDEDLHTTTWMKNKVKSKLLLNVVIIRKGATIFQLLSSKYNCLTLPTHPV